jgi:hypothetical protein
LRQRHTLVDYFFSLAPFDQPSRLENIFSLASKSIVEVETHPANLEEYRYLVEGKLCQYTANIKIGSSSLVRKKVELGK